MRIEFTVKDRPPKKHGEKSMWAQDSEAPRIVSLRQEAIKARAKAGMNDYFRSLVTLEFTLFVPRSQLESVGDLDNFITGICDGLQVADPKAPIHQRFKQPGQEAIDPGQPVLFIDDSKVISITAKKMAVDNGQEIYYQITVEQV